MKQTRDTNNIIFSSTHNERQHHTPEPPKKPACITWSKHVAPNANITPQNPQKNLLIVPHEANAWHQQHHLL